MLRCLSIVTLFIGFNALLQAQGCTGNLGENIFTAGDFGSGAANVLTPDPGIAPGYQYQQNPPPNDGFYTITNNTTDWGFFAEEFWVDTGDNSNDPNGYMMVVNASFEPGLFYEQQVDGLCENTLYVFTADVLNLNLNPGPIPPNVSFLLDGQVRHTTGDIPENRQWNSYGFTFTTEPGQTSLSLALQNNAPGGGGNDLALDNIEFRACGPEALILPDIVANICEDGNPIDIEATVNGDQYPDLAIQWQQSFDEGATWQDIPGATNLVYPFDNLAAGTYFYRYLLANGPSNLSNTKCRVNSNVKVINVLPKFTTVVDTVCAGLSAQLAGVQYDSTGLYTDTLTNFLGCDSVVNLDLTVLPFSELEAAFTPSDPSCSDTQDGAITLDTIFNGTAPYDISINGTPSNGLLANAAAGEYRFQIEDRFGCTLDTLFTLMNPNPFTVNLGRDRTVELGESVVITPQFSAPAMTFDWRPVTVDCGLDCQQLELLPTTTTTVTLTAENSITGCLASDTLLLTVDPVRRVYIPNAFSPNGDGVNDRFFIFGDQPNVTQIESLTIYDRWGGVRYQVENVGPSDPKTGWDGTSNGIPALAGNYTYLAKIRFLDNQIVHYEGNIALIR